MRLGRIRRTRRRRGGLHRRIGQHGALVGRSGPGRNVRPRRVTLRSGPDRRSLSCFQAGGKRGATHGRRRRRARLCRQEIRRPPAGRAAAISPERRQTPVLGLIRYEPERLDRSRVRRAEQRISPVQRTVDRNQKNTHDAPAYRRGRLPENTAVPAPEHLGDPTDQVAERQSVGEVAARVGGEIGQLGQCVVDQVDDRLKIIEVRMGQDGVDVQHLVDLAVEVGDVCRVGGRHPETRRDVANDPGDGGILGLGAHQATAVRGLYTVALAASPVDGVVPVPGTIGAAAPRSELRVVAVFHEVADQPVQCTERIVNRIGKAANRVPLTADGDDVVR